MKNQLRSLLAIAVIMGSTVAVASTLSDSYDFDQMNIQTELNEIKDKQWDLEMNQSIIEERQDEIESQSSE